MSHAIIARVTTAVLCAALLTFAVAAAAWPGDGRSRAVRLDENKTFTVSAEYSGYLSGEIMMHGRLYRLAPGTRAYVVGEGMRPLGFMVNRRSVFLAGEYRGRVPVVHSIVVRRAANGSRVVSTGELAAETPR
jgi:hypothetical protein